MKKPRRKFTKRQLETAVEVLKECRTVQKWVRAQANFLGIDLTTPEGEEYLDRETGIAGIKQDGIDMSRNGLGFLDRVGSSDVDDLNEGNAG